MSSHLPGFCPPTGKYGKKIPDSFILAFTIVLCCEYSM